MKDKLQPVLELFSIGKIIIIGLAIFAGSTFYMYILTKQIAVSAILGIFAMIFGFYHSVYLPKKMNREQYLLKELQRYGISMTFYLQSGYNVLQALNLSKQKLDKQIKKDIEKTMIKLEEEAVLDTTHFKKYKFNALDIFHQILEIKYIEGGDSKNLFTKANESMNFEIVKRDELYRRKKQVMKRIMIMLGITASIPVILAFSASELYEQFLTMGFYAIGLNVVLFILMQISLFFLQKNATDISISK